MHWWKAENVTYVSDGGEVISVTRRGVTEEHRDPSGQTIIHAEMVPVAVERYRVS